MYVCMYPDWRGGEKRDGKERGEHKRGERREEEGRTGGEREGKDPPALLSLLTVMRLVTITIRPRFAVEM